MVEFRKTATIDEFTMDDTVSLVNGKYIELMELQVPAQQLNRFGNGAIINGVDDRGSLKLDVQTSGSANIPGTARLVVADANKVIRNFRREDRSEDLTSTNGVKVARDQVAAKEDSFLTIEYKADADATAAKAQSSASIPLTITTL